MCTLFFTGVKYATPHTPERLAHCSAIIGVSGMMLTQLFNSVTNNYSPNRFEKN
jgi:hypothetical protein